MRNLDARLRWSDPGFVAIFYPSDYKNSPWPTYQNNILISFRLHDKVNIIPVIAKADTMTPDEIVYFKDQVKHLNIKKRIKINSFLLIFRSWDKLQSQVSKYMTSLMRAHLSLKRKTKRRFETWKAESHLQLLAPIHSSSQQMGKGEGYEAESILGE